MTTDPKPWAGATYRGFSGPPPAAPSSARPTRSWPIPRPVAIGIAGAIALGLIGGMWARPELEHPRASAPMRAVTSEEDATPAKVAIELNALPPPQAVKPAGRLDVLPPDLARSAARALPVTAADPATTATDASARFVQIPPRVMRVDTPAPLAPPAAADPCPTDRGGAAHLVCADPDLAAADRELNRAYRRALRSGAPPEQLRDEQRDWLAIREDAARRSPRAVASIYEQRIDELNRIADDGGDPG
jgi:uncharacterized protein YecT (DUF1311 family)